jgi:hypothetical protein
MAKDFIAPVEGEDKNYKGDIFHYGRNRKAEKIRTEVFIEKLRTSKPVQLDTTSTILDNPTNGSVYETVNKEIAKMHKDHLINDEPIKNLNIYRNKRWNKPKNIYKKFYPKAEPKPALTPTGKKPFTDLLEYLSACEQLNIKPILSYRPLGLSKSYLTINLANFEYDQERIYKKTGDKVVHTYFMKDIVKYGGGKHESAI